MTIRREMKGRDAVELVIGHAKALHRKVASRAGAARALHVANGSGSSVIENDAHRLRGEDCCLGAGNKHAEAQAGGCVIPEFVGFYRFFPVVQPCRTCSFFIGTK